MCSRPLTAPFPSPDTLQGFDVFLAVRGPTLYSTCSLTRAQYRGTVTSPVQGHAPAVQMGLLILFMAASLPSERPTSGDMGCCRRSARGTQLSEHQALGRSGTEGAAVQHEGLCRALCFPACSCEKGVEKTSLDYGNICSREAKEHLLGEAPGLCCHWEGSAHLAVPLWGRGSCWSSSTIPLGAVGSGQHALPCSLEHALLCRVWVPQPCSEVKPRMKALMLRSRSRWGPGSSQPHGATLLLETVGTSITLHLRSARTHSTASVPTPHPKIHPQPAQCPKKRLIRSTALSPGNL